MQNPNFEFRSMDEEQKLETKLLKLGKELSSFPLANDLYAHLDEIDGLLSMVEQAPSQTMLNALQPLIKALAAKNFLQHSDKDVKVVVASCFSEITRITVPEMPFDDDDILKEIFWLIVGSFAELDNTSSHLYEKSVSILETIAKVRSYAVMIDLKCDDLIFEMFQHFLKTIRDENYELLFDHMETVMTLVIEDTDDVPIELLSVLLCTLKKDKKALPIAQCLAQRVLYNCASRISLQLMDLVRTRGAPLSEYHMIVASICEENFNLLDKLEDINNEVQVSIEIPKHFVSNSGCDNLEPNAKNSDDFEKYVIEDCRKEDVDPKVNEISTTVTEGSVSVGIENKSEASISVQADSNTIETKRKRGRPRKSFVARESSMDDTNKKSSGSKKLLDECLVGSKIKVWWPHDKQLYEGVVESYDRVTKRHMIVYTDGDIEELMLKNERWEYVEDGDMSQTKRTKIDSTLKQAKFGEQAKSIAEASSKGTQRRRGRPRKEAYKQNSDTLSDNTSPATVKQSNGESSSDVKITTTKLLLKFKDVAKSPSSGGMSKGNKGTSESTTKWKIVFSKTETKNGVENTPSVSGL